ncbi:MAG: hypothetical protein NC816_02595, partial [Candidatus Omnitrophica bacterium]|nr:hypothetical protein [Candidatus Omnitrophota bacterium]
VEEKVEVKGKENKIEEIEEKSETIFDFKQEREPEEKQKDEEQQEQSKREYKELKWEEILKQVKIFKPTLEAALREGKLEKIEGENIYILFESKYSFHKSMVEKPSNKIKIEKIIFDFTGKNYKIIPVLKENTQAIIENPDVKKIIEFFNGEIIQMEE